MIYTITFNPAIDLVYQLDNQLQPGELNRSQSEQVVAGGKGINISVLLHKLGIKSTATGFVGGFTGQYIINVLENQQIPTHFISVDGITRINAKINDNEMTEVNGSGPAITPDNMQSLLTYLNTHLTDADTIFLAGNKGNGMSADDYIAVSKLANRNGAKLIIDSNTDLLTSCLTHQPFMVKPNKDELSDIFGVEIKTDHDVIHYAKELQQMGARNVLVSMGGEGSLLLTVNNEVYKASVPEGEVINPTGAGDSMLAGFMAKYIETEDYQTSLQLAAACGSATAFSTGIASRSLINSLIDQIKITKKGD